MINAADSDNELSTTVPIFPSIHFSESQRVHKVSQRQKFISSVRSIRNASNQSIRDLAEVDRSTSSMVAGYNVMNLIQGIGVLGLPYAVVKGGWIAAVMIPLVAAIACSTGKMIVDCLYDQTLTEESRRVRRTYSCIGAAVWPEFGRALITTFTFIEVFGGTTLYIILMSVESSNLLDKFTLHIDLYYCLLILTYLALPLTFINRMSLISWFSFIAVLGLIGTMATIIIFSFYHIHLISLNNWPAISWTSVPLSLGIITFSYCAHPAFPGIESCMKYPSSFNTMMNISFIVTAIFKFSMAILFVLIFGIRTQQQCSMNLHNFYFSTILETFIIMSTFFSIPLTTFIITEQIDEYLQHHFHHSMWPGGRNYWFWLLLTRSVILTASMFIAMMVPHFALMMGLVGSITGSCLTFIFPCIFSLVLKKHELSVIGKCYRLFIIMMGVIFGITGTIVSMSAIIKTFR